MWFLRGGLGRGSFVVLYVGLVAMPLLIARVVHTAIPGFGINLASGLGMSAFVMLLAGFWLTGRFQVISARAGLDLILTFHRYAAVGAIVLLIAHIVAVRAAGAGAPSPAAWVAFGIVVLIAVLAQARSRFRMRFEVWRLTHGLGALLVALAGLAHTVSDGVYSSGAALRTFWFTMVVVAVGSLVWVHAVRPARKARHPYEVVGVAMAADRTWTVTVEPKAGEAMEFVAGQYAFVSFGERGYRHPGNPFSFSSAPSDRPRIEFTIKESGDLTDHISEIEIGSVAYLDGPLGHLSPGNYRGPRTDIDGVVLVAGGVGITPMISILREGKHRGQREPITLLYGAHSPHELSFVDEIEALKEHLNLTTHYVVSEPTADWKGHVGRLDDAFLSQHLTDAQRGHMFFVCGSTGLIDSVLDNLDRHALATPGLVHSENFSIYD